MNTEWSELNKTMQAQLKKKDTFHAGVDTLLTLRETLMSQLISIKNELTPAEFSAMPFPDAKGYHSKTIAYSIWHIFRIEDIVVHSLILQDEELLWECQNSIGTAMTTTGNELAGRQIAEFSRELDIDALYRYADRVKHSTDAWLRRLAYEELNRRFDSGDKARLQELQVVSPDESACWLLDYWCGKTVRGLLQMPLSRHWIMHIEASLRIRAGILKQKSTPARRPDMSDI